MDEDFFFFFFGKSRGKREGILAFLRGSLTSDRVFTRWKDKNVSNDNSRFTREIVRCFWMRVNTEAQEVQKE